MKSINKTYTTMKTKLLFLFLSISAAIHANDFRNIFDSEYKEALSFIKKNKTTINKITAFYKNDTAVVVSSIFPELIRYSIIRDFLETKALEYLYVNGGKGVADFSIGSFQMKPSFIEELEIFLIANPILRDKYKNVVSYASNTVLGERSERLNRLKSLEWQIIYANCFYDAMMLRFPELEDKTKSYQIQFVSTAYNAGLNKSALEIKRLGQLKMFPFGPQYKGEQYSYNDIAVNFYKKHFKISMN